MADPVNIADFQQRRGAALDIIDEALEDYRCWMLDDDYDAQATLDRIMARMRERRDLIAPSLPLHTDKRSR